MIILKQIWAWLQRLNQKITALLLLVVLIPFVMLTFLNLRFNVGLLNQEVEQRQLETTRIMATEITSFLANLSLYLDQISYTWVTASPSEAELANLLQAYQTGNPLYTRLWIMDATGQDIAHVHNGVILLAQNRRNYSEEEVFFRPLRGETYYSTVRTAEFQPRLTVSRPIYRGETLVGVVAADINLAEPWAIIQTLTLGEEGYSFLVDKRGNLLVHGNREVTMLRPNFAANPAIANALSADPQYALYEYTNPLGVEVITTALQVEGPNWVLAAERPRAEAYLAEDQLQDTTLIAFAIAFLAAIGLSLIVTRQITRPIYALRQAAVQLGGGNLEVRLENPQQDEIGDLGRTFNQMAERLQNSMAQLNQRNHELRIATAKAREAARVKSEFLATMSHELRTPLNAIIGFSDMLLIGMSGPLNEKQEHKIRRLQENGKRLLTLVNDVLDLTRIEAGRVELNVTGFSPITLGQRISEQMNVLAEQNQLSFRTEFDPHLPTILYGDEKRIEQIIINLLSNAFKFTEKGGVILRLIHSPEEENWHIAVRDTGVGIPPHAFEYIFDEFRQLDGSSRRAFKGTGLGLAITRQLVRIMDGNIKVDSKLGEGSTFTVTLPLRPTEDQSQEVVTT